ncbi:MAG: iron chelate uptake ABC transporter family permease subunit [Candidatus Eisenbacteria bacterium]|nr:iron chelate uptake ABC transporter family permease subunit [Candidatus Eisenbacteria bacterium]
MIEFVSAIVEHAFLRNALLTGLLVSVACGLVGSYVVVRRMTYIAGGIAHCVLGGIGAAVYLERAHGWSMLDPLYGAVVAALVAAVAIGLVSLRARERVDTAIGATWAIGMATGVLFLARTPGYAQDLMGYLFGNILLVSVRDMQIIGAFDAIILVTALAFHNQLLSISFDEEYARARGINVDFYHMLLLVLVALTVVLLVTVVGVVLVIALLTIPAAIAGRFRGTLTHMMGLAVLVSAALTTGGLAVSYGLNTPTGATIVLLAGAAYVVSMLVARQYARRRRET